MNTTILAFNNITVRSLNQVIFKDLSFEIRENENWALIGESGSGKSALLETIAGRLGVSKGHIDHTYFDSRQGVAGELVNWHKRVSFVSSRHSFRNLSNTTEFYYQQRYNSFDSDDAPTVASYLAGLSLVEHSAYWTMDRVVDRLNLRDLLVEQIIKLSNGETKRLLLAAALLKNPVLLLLDSPLAGLDVGRRADFNNLLAEINQSGIRIIMATSPLEIPDAITHIAVLNEGKVRNAGTRDEFSIDKYQVDSHVEIDEGELRELIERKPVESFEFIVRMNNVHIRYGDAVILKDINWTIRQGERWALVGANGSGKSTLLSLINGDNPQAYANDILLFDRKRGSGESIWDIKKKIGFVSPELFQYFPSAMTCIQVVESGFYGTLGLFRPSNHKLAEIARRWMGLIGVDVEESQLFRHVSASKQRLCLLARAMVKNPPLLIFDEPCQGLDAHQQAHFKQVVNSICKNSKASLIYVSHYHDELPEVIEQTLTLDKQDL